MGSWNATCGISHLPIFHGEKIRLFILLPNSLETLIHSPNSICNVGDIYSIIGMPIQAEYNDYGTVENIVEDFNTDFIHKTLKHRALMPCDKPFNVDDEVSYKSEGWLKVVSVDCENVTVVESMGHNREEFIVKSTELKHCTKEDYYNDPGDIENMIRLIERNVFEVNINPLYKQFCDIHILKPALFFVKESMWQASQIDVDISTFSMNVSKYIGGIEEFTTDIENEIALSKLTSDDDVDVSSTAKMNLITQRFSNFSKIERLSKMFERSHRRGSDLHVYTDLMLRLIEAGDMDQARNVVERVIRVYKFINFMDYTRRTLIPQGGTGSQGIGENFHGILNDAISKEIHDIKHMVDEENYE